ncbi:MAG: aminotransferase class V-fold PLP-dependent enzyme [Sporomusaceae bacterium]|jgi:selenocysteine lyase/cysteine desulfurase|nr:aminotransferase class V-fold PLP-dependent enzyme [Sporomusaceae bacterium]
MIYFDNSATTLIKPPEVAAAVASAINSFGNAGRSFYEPVLKANREIFQTRWEIAKLIGLEEPLNVAFTSCATESLNLVIGGLVQKNDTVITTVTEHNSVLRPLYLKGCDLRVLDCDEKGSLSVDSFVALLDPGVKFFVCTHGSNVTGNITQVEKFYDLCKSHGITMILDISQTFGTIPVNIKMADIFCFTGHKGLFGPQGTGGVIVNGNFDFAVVKTGGAGNNSFNEFQAKNMPDILEVGTLNGHSIYGLQQGVRFINETGVDTIQVHDTRLTKMFYDGIKDLPQIKIYGDFTREHRLPVVSINIAGLTSAELSEILWEKYGIATRAGSHCAPVLH